MMVVPMIQAPYFKPNTEPRPTRRAKADKRGGRTEVGTRWPANALYETVFTARHIDEQH